MHDSLYFCPTNQSIDCRNCWALTKTSSFGHSLARIGNKTFNPNLFLSMQHMTPVSKSSSALLHMKSQEGSTSQVVTASDSDWMEINLQFWFMFLTLRILLIWCFHGTSPQLASLAAAVDQIIPGTSNASVPWTARCFQWNGEGVARGLMASMASRGHILGIPAKSEVFSGVIWIPKSSKCRETTLLPSWMATSGLQKLQQNCVFPRQPHQEKWLSCQKIWVWYGYPLVN